MNAYKHALLAAAGIGLMFGTGIALAQETPAAAPAGVKLIEAAAVQALQGKGAVLIDTRKTSEFSEGTIKGAISVPYDPEKSAKDVKFDAAQDKFDMAKIADKNKDYVVFCNSGTCWKSYKAAVVMSKAGYKNVHWYRNGMPDWKARKLPME
ncbi:MAG: rhodanese-like domain-containing protein [Rhodocyclales bacterium]|nr:rhodanese-like domain-containing protein [Rhodocyclales bacterium]